MIKKIMKKAIFFLAFMLAVSNMPVSYAAEAVYADNSDYKVKISKELLEELDKQRYTQVIIKMKEQADTAKARENAIILSGNLEESLATAQNRLSSYVVNAMIETQERTQKGILDYIKDEKEAGNVKEYESFYIVNSLYVEATKTVIENIARRDDVLSITENVKIKADKPVIEKRGEYVTTADADAAGSIPWNIKEIQADKAHLEGVDGEGVVVGIIDSGVDYTHPAISEAWRGKDGVNAVFSWKDFSGENASKPVDGTGHGTHVAGTILGKEENGRIIGVAPKAKWIAARVFDSSGETDLKKLYAAGQWIMAPTDEHGVPQASKAPKLVNSSWGGKSEDAFFRDILVKWRDAGILPVFSAGNVSASNPGGEGSIGTPASYKEAFAVGAVRRDDKIAKFSLLGPGRDDYSGGEAKPDVVAPGVNIRSAAKGGGYVLMNGTSMASPHVAGLAALIYQIKPQATPDEVEEIIKETATPLKDDKYVSYPNMAYGYGKVNAYKAAQMAKKGKDSFASLSGRLLTKGSDKEAPKIEHIPFKTMFNTFDLDVESRVFDDNGIQSVKLYFAPKGSSVYTERVMQLEEGNKKEGRYSTKIKVAEMDPQGVDYYIEAVDITGRTNKTQLISTKVSGGIKIGTTQTFEDEIDGYIFGGKTPMWQWGEAKSGPNSAVSGKKLVGTNLQGAYTGLVDTTMIMPVIDLTESSEPNAALTFKHWWSLDQDENYAFFDTAEIWIGEVNGTDLEKIKYKQIRTYKYSSRDWKDEYIDLSSYKGKKIVVMFGMRYAGYSPRSKDGWYIDDISLQEASADIPATPSKDLEITYKSNGQVQFEFEKLKDPKISKYCLYRSDKKDGEYKLVNELDISSISQYASTVKITDFPRPQSGEYFYYATAKIGENEGGHTEILSKKFTQGEKQENLSFDFESGEQGWKSEGDNVWNYGVPKKFEALDDEYTNKPNEKTSLGKNDGEKLWGVDLENMLKPNKNKKEFVLESATMDLSQLGKAKAYYQNWHHFDKEDDNDTAEVFISKDNGSNWEKVTILNSETLSNEPEKEKRLEAVPYRVERSWYLDSFEIPNDFLTDEFKVKFVFNRGKSYESVGGWYIDDFSIYKLDAGISGSSENEYEVFDTKHSIPMGDYVMTNSSNTGDTLVPVVGTLSIKETGVSVTSEIGTGNFILKHPKGNYTLIAEAKGYRLKEENISIGENKDVVLEKLQDGGLYVSAKSADGSSLTDGKLRLIDGSEKLEFSLEADGTFVKDDLAAGTYILQITAQGYLPFEKLIKIEEQSRTEITDAVLNKFSYENISEDEIKYDDGTPESYLPILGDGGTIGVKMTASKPSVLKSIKFMFGEVPYISPENKAFKYAIYGKNNVDGYPTRILAGPFTALAGKGNTWTEIKLPENIVVDGEFYVAYTQIGKDAIAPKIAMDRDTLGKGKCFKLINGAWNIPSEIETYMIRANLVAKDGKPSGETVKPGVPGDSGGSGNSGGSSSSGSSSGSSGSGKESAKNLNEQNVQNPLSNISASEKEQAKKIYARINDVKNHWAGESIKFVVENGIFKGVSRNKFEPESGMTRAMLVTAFYRLEKSPKASEQGFSDVPKGVWYADSVNWAKGNKIVRGSTSNQFLPQKAITREEIVTMLYNYASWKNQNMNRATDLESFDDYNQISAWAINAMNWAVAMEYMQGRGESNLDPKAEITRAEVATILTKYIKSLETANK